MNKTKKLTLLAMLVTLATALHALELLIPNPLPLPGTKLGLANVVTLVTLLQFGFKEGLAVSLLRVLFASFLTGTFLTLNFTMSLAGALLSALVMGLLYYNIKSFSILGISVAGAVVHNIAQLAIAFFATETPGIFFYLPFLLLIGVPVGLLTGAIAGNVYKHLKNLNILH
ncbi:Gx transporter family protein [Bacillota bacterium LX-D]|nr:Gx transporter family protein [Bacillota bacterium LX-D]